MPGDAANRRRPARLGRESLAWLILVSVLFGLSELIPALLRLPLGADEISYIARSSIQHSGVYLPPVHGHGAGLLGAPVTLLTASLTVLRIWMAVLSGLALFGSLLCWRGLRPAWVLAIAGFIFGSLAITRLSGVQVYPDLWAAFGALAITGLLLQAVQGRLRPRFVLPLIAFVAFIIVLMRPQNIAFVLVPTFLAPLAVRGWRKPGVLIAMIIGMAAGILEWVAEAYVWFGGLGSRIQLAGHEPPKFGVNFSLPMQIRTLSGPWYTNCTAAPGHCPPNYSYPVLYLWWLVFFALAALGLFAAWRLPSRASSVLALISGAWLVMCYLLFVPFGAPRYFLPTWALLAIVAADGIAWLARVPKWKTTGAVLAGAFLLSWAVSQHVVLVGETANAASSRQFVQRAEVLKNLGIKPPCAVGSPSVAYFVGCTARWAAEPAYAGATMKWILARTPGGVKAWRKVHLHPGGPDKYVWIRRGHSRSGSGARASGSGAEPGRNVAAVQVHPTS